MIIDIAEFTPKEFCHLVINKVTKYWRFHDKTSLVATNARAAIIW